MKILILTSSRYGEVAWYLSALCASPRLQVVQIVLAHRAPSNKKQFLITKIKKIRKIGLLGAINGIRMRKWFRVKEGEDIIAVAKRYNIPLAETPVLNSEETRRLFREAQADLGLSLGNGYIQESVFSIPRHGMINIHGEILPEFRGAQSIIWPIYEGKEESGFTIHQIDKGIDSGTILFQKRYPITFYPTLRETVEKTLEKARAQIPEALVWVCENYEDLKKQAKPQGPGKSYTTPTIWQFLRMRRNHRKMYVRSLRAGKAST